MSKHYQKERASVLLQINFYACLQNNFRVLGSAGRFLSEVDLGVLDSQFFIFQMRLGSSSQGMWIHRTCAIRNQKISISAFKSLCIISGLVFGAHCLDSSSWHVSFSKQIMLTSMTIMFLIHYCIKSQKMNECMDIFSKTERRHTLPWQRCHMRMRCLMGREQSAEAVQSPTHLIA